MSNKAIFKESITNSEKISIGTKVWVNPMAELTNQDKWRTGVVTYINRKNRWFLVEFKSSMGDVKMRRSYYFYDVGSKVKILSGKTRHEW